MPRLQYGETTIEWQFQPEAGLKRHYVTVERGRPVLLRGPWVAVPEQEALVRRRARWIREKLALVNKPLADHAIVTGSRLKYCGRSYFTEVRHTPALTAPRLAFTASRFVVECPWGAPSRPKPWRLCWKALPRARGRKTAATGPPLGARNRAQSCTGPHPAFSKPMGKLRRRERPAVPPQVDGTSRQRAGLRHRP